MHLYQSSNFAQGDLPVIFNSSAPIIFDVICLESQIFPNASIVPRSAQRWPPSAPLSIAHEFSAVLPFFGRYPPINQRDPNFSDTSVMSGRCPLKEKDELRATTNKLGIFDKSVIKSSAIPSEKYSCSGSPLMLSKGSTAIECLVLLAHQKYLTLGVPSSIFTA